MVAQGTTYHQCCNSILLYEDHHQPLSSKGQRTHQANEVGILQLPDVRMIGKLRLVEATADLAAPGDPTKKH